MHIVIGCEREQEAITKILIASIKKYTKTNGLQFHRGYELSQRLPKKILKLISSASLKGGTVFSIQRLFGFILFDEPSIYLDSDMILKSNISNLLDLCERFEERYKLYVTASCPEYGIQTSVCYWPAHCYTRKERLELASKTIEQFSQTGNVDKSIKKFFELTPEIPGEWNCREASKIRDTNFKLAHFTDMGDQPWLRKRSKYGFVWHKLANDLIIENPELSVDIKNSIENKEIGPWVGINSNENIIKNIFFIPKYTGRNSKLALIKRGLRIIRNVRDEFFRG